MSYIFHNKMLLFLVNILRTAPHGISIKLTTNTTIPTAVLAINLARGSLCEGRVQRRTVPFNGNRSKSMEIKESIGSNKPQH